MKYCIICCLAFMMVGCQEEKKKETVKEAPLKQCPASPKIMILGNGFGENSWEADTSFAQLREPHQMIVIAAKGNYTQSWQSLKDEEFYLSMTLQRRDGKALKPGKYWFAARDTANQNVMNLIIRSNKGSTFLDPMKTEVEIYQLGNTICGKVEGYGAPHTDMGDAKIKGTFSWKLK